MTIDMTNITHSEAHETLWQTNHTMIHSQIITTMNGCHKNYILCANCSNAFLVPIMEQHVYEYGKYKCLLLMIPVNKTFFIGDDENLEYEFLLNNETEPKFLETP